MGQRRSRLVWLPYVVISVVHVAALVVQSPIAPPTKVALMPLLAIPVLAAHGLPRQLTALLLGVRLFLPDIAPAWFSPAVMATYTLGQGLIIAGALQPVHRTLPTDRDAQRANGPT